MHSHEYTGDDPEIFRGKRVVVLGMGNSAMDIAVESSYAAAATYLAARRGVGDPEVRLRPMDQISTQAGVPFRVKQAVARTALRLVVGDMERYGLPKPDHRLLEPTRRSRTTSSRASRTARSRRSRTSRG